MIAHFAFGAKDSKIERWFLIKNYNPHLFKPEKNYPSPNSEKEALILNKYGLGIPKPVEDTIKRLLYLTCLPNHLRQQTIYQ